MRPRLIFFTFVSAAAPALPASAQSTPQRCAQLEAELADIRVEMENSIAATSKVSNAYTTALRRVEALDGAARNPILVVLLDAEPYSASGMRGFRDENRLSGDLDQFIRQPREFWRLAASELSENNKSLSRRQERLIQRRIQVEEEYRTLLCRPAAREASGPLPIQRRPDGQPIITDPLITRWVKATYALKTTGGAYWQVGQMSQQDYIEVDRRINLYFDIANSGRVAEQFSDDEMRALNPRLPDIGNVRKGNWSLIKL